DQLHAQRLDLREHLRLGERAGHVERRTQGQRAHVLGLGAELEAQGFRCQRDLAGDEHRRVVGIDDADDTTMLITGQVSLAAETLGLKFSAKPKDMSPLTLRAPLNVTGTFSKPKVFPEVQTLSVKLI